MQGPATRADGLALALSLCPVLVCPPVHERGRRRPRVNMPFLGMEAGGCDVCSGQTGVSGNVQRGNDLRVSTGVCFAVVNLLFCFVESSELRLSTFHLRPGYPSLSDSSPSHSFVCFYSYFPRHFATTSPPPPFSTRPSSLSHNGVRAVDSR